MVTVGLDWLIGFPVESLGIVADYSLRGPVSSFIPGSSSSGA